MIGAERSASHVFEASEGLRALASVHMALPRSPRQSAALSCRHRSNWALAKASTIR